MEPKEVDHFFPKHVDKERQWVLYSKEYWEFSNRGRVGLNAGQTKATPVYKLLSAPGMPVD